MSKRAITSRKRKRRPTVLRRSNGCAVARKFIIERDAEPVTVVHPADRRVRPLSESLRLAREHGSTTTLDEEIDLSYRENRSQGGECRAGACPGLWPTQEPAALDVVKGSALHVHGDQ
jgi:hypothetical protein